MIGIGRKSEADREGSASVADDREDTRRFARL